MHHPHMVGSKRMTVHACFNLSKHCFKCQFDTGYHMMSQDQVWQSKCFVSQWKSTENLWISEIRRDMVLDFLATGVPPSE